MPREKTVIQRVHRPSIITLVHLARPHVSNPASFSPSSENHTARASPAHSPRAERTRAFVRSRTRASPALVPTTASCDPSKRRLSIDHWHERSEMTRVRRVCAASLVSFRVRARPASRSRAEHARVLLQRRHQDRVGTTRGATIKRRHGRDFWVDVDMGESTYESPFDG